MSINSSIHQELNGQSCQRNISECFFCTTKGSEAIQNSSEKITARQRQLLLLLDKQDSISKKLSENLLTRIPVKQLLEAEMIVQHSPCSGFCIRLVDSQAQFDTKQLNECSNSDVSGVLNMLENARIRKQANDSLSSQNNCQQVIEPALQLIADRAG